MMIKVSAPAKIHFSGEHSVVYDYPALLSAINRRITATLEPKKLQEIEIIDKKLKIQEKTTFGKIRNFSYLNPFPWQVNDPLGLVKVGLDGIYSFLEKKPEKGFTLTINSQIPIGCGLGSSAALMVCLTATVLFWEKNKQDKNLVNQIAYELEKKQHFNPSGGDNTTVCFGGILKFQKQKEKFAFKKINIFKPLPRFLLVDSGRPKEATAEMVMLVRQKLNKRTKEVLRLIGQTTHKFIEVFEKGNFKNLKNLIDENELFLEELGVVGKKAKKIIKLIRKNGGAAKICGAGGVKEGSGMILVYHPLVAKMEKIFGQEKISFEKINLNEEGVKIENH